MLLLAIVVGVVSAQFPGFVAGDLDATWACDNPQCPMICRPRCDALNCTATCDMGFDCTTTPSCAVDCPNYDNGQPVSMDCPMCNAVCQPLGCTNCITTCEPVNCEWECFLPQSCPYPVCELVAASPACKAWATTLQVSSYALLVVLGISIVL